MKPGKQFSPIVQNKDGSFHPPMFMTAREIMQHTRYGDGYTHNMTPDEALEMKYASASKPRERVVNITHGGGRGRVVPTTIRTPDGILGHDGGLKEEIDKHGYDWSKPVTVNLHDDEGNFSPYLLEGHHRVAVMMKTAPDEPIPVEFHWDWHNSMVAEYGSHYKQELGLDR
jgi:hypothetical protein